MMRLKMLFVCLLFVATFLAFFSAHAQLSNPQQTLNQYISDLQKNPNDYALREKIIKHVQTMTPKPAMSSEAEKYEGRAEYAIKNAKNEADFLDAAKEYDKALLLAPWVSSYYFNQAIAYEKAGKPKEAKRSFEFYLLAAPDAQDARDVRKRIAGLEYAAEKATKETSPEAIAAKKQNTFEDLLRKIDGRRYTHVQHYKPGNPGIHIIDVQGKFLLWGWHPEREAYTGPHGRVEIKGYESEYHFIGNTDEPERCWTYIISEDGSTITFRDSFTHGRLLGEAIYNWQR
jgi:tetratricopeptide (TPR) repeat protein